MTCYSRIVVFTLWSYLVTSSHSLVTPLSSAFSSAVNGSSSLSVFSHANALNKTDNAAFLATSSGRDQWERLNKTNRGDRPDPSNERVCSFLPDGAAPVVVGHPDYDIGVNLVGWWDANILCLQIYDPVDPWGEQQFYYNTRFFPQEGPSIISVVGYNFNDFRIVATACPPQYNRMLLSFVGYSHGAYYNKYFAVDWFGRMASAHNCDPDVGMGSRGQNLTAI